MKSVGFLNKITEFGYNFLSFVDFVQIYIAAFHFRFCNNVKKYHNIYCC